jgi:lysophospholipase L1-like esterase
MRSVLLLMALGTTLCGGDTHPEQRSGKAGEHSWVEPMRQVHARFKGKPGTLACFGDSITVTMAFWSPLPHRAKDLPPDGARAYKLVNGYMNADCWAKWKGPEFGNNGSMTIRWAHENVGAWLKKLNPEAAVIMFGTNDLTELTLDEFERKTRDVVKRCLDNGTVVLLTTLPPRSGLADKSSDFAGAVRRIAKDTHVPLIDYQAEILARRPKDWDGSLPKFKQGPGDTYDVPTFIARDGVHPSNPKKHQTYTPEALRHNGYALRTYLTLLAYAEVIRSVLK